jgi:trehalose-6-phosphate hydrolase
MTNPNFKRIEDYRDVETLNAYKLLREEGKTEKEILAIFQQKSRDNGRTPVQWDDNTNGGFSSGTPWISIADNYDTVNVNAALRDPNSIFYHYQKLIALRKKYDVIVNGGFELLVPDDPNVFAYVRTGMGEQLLVVSNFTDQSQSFFVPEELLRGQSELLISNYADSPVHVQNLQLRPYESVAYHLINQ